MFAAFAVIGKHGDADAGAHFGIACFQAEWQVQHFDDGLGRSCHLAGAAIPDDDAELVTGQPGDGVLQPYGAAQAFGHVHQQFVAGLVAQRIVDVLETVQVQQQGGKSTFFFARNIDFVR